MNQFYSALTMVFDFMATGTGQPSTLAMGIGAATLVVITVLIGIVGWKKAPREDKQDTKYYLLDAVGLGRYVECIGVADDEEDMARENPAPADAFTHLPHRGRVQKLGF